MNLRLSLIETIAKTDRLSNFSRLMGTSGANEIFSSGGDFTVFAPTNDAFGKIPDAKMNALLQEPGQATLKALLSFHILPGKMFAANLAAKQTQATVTGAEVTITDSGGLKVNSSGVQIRNIEALNGVLHEIDTVLVNDAPHYATGPLSPVAGSEKSQVTAGAQIMPFHETATKDAVARAK